MKRYQSQDINEESFERKNKNNVTFKTKIGIVFLLLLIGLTLYNSGFRIIKRKVVDNVSTVTLEKVEKELEDNEVRRYTRNEERKIERLFEECVIKETVISENNEEELSITVTGELLDLINEENRLYKERLENGEIESELALDNDDKNEFSSNLLTHDIDPTSFEYVPDEDLLANFEKENEIARDKLNH